MKIPKISQKVGALASQAIRNAAGALVGDTKAAVEGQLTVEKYEKTMKPSRNMGALGAVATSKEDASKAQLDSEGYEKSMKPSRNTGDLGAVATSKEDASKAHLNSEGYEKTMKLSPDGQALRPVPKFNRR